MKPDPDLTSDVPGMALWGWMSEAELKWLGSQAAKMQTVVEIGCLHGRSSFALATACPGTVYCIDPWSDDGWASWSASMKEFTDTGKVVPIRLPSPDGGALVPDPVDMVFIDGAHDYASVVADITYWKPRTQKLLCGHDYVPISERRGDESAFPGVPTAVDELVGDITIAGDTAIWAWKWKP